MLFGVVMKYVSCSCLVSLMFLFFGCSELHSETTRNEKNLIKKSKKKVGPRSRSAHDGVFFEVGLSVGNQKSSANNRDFIDNPAAVDAVRYGGSAALSYIAPVSSNFYLGICGGIEGSFGPHKMWNGGRLQVHSNSFIKRRSVLRNVLQSISNMVIQDDGYLPIDIFKDRVDYLRCLGQQSAERYVDFPKETPEVYTVRDAFDQVKMLGDENSENRLESGLQNLGCFTAQYFPSVSRILTHIAYGEKYDILDEKGLSSKIGAEKVDCSASVIIGELFQGQPYIQDGRYYCEGTCALYRSSQVFPKGTLPQDQDCSFDQEIGYEKEQRELSYALKAINDLYYNTDDSNPELLKYRGIPNGDTSEESVTEQKNRRPYKFHSKTKFDLCPYVALQFGYFIKELDGVVYTKLGAMQLNGRSTVACDVTSVYDEKFHRWTPYVVVGFNKSISECWGVSVEVGHAFKTSKEFNIKYGNDKIREKIAVSRTTIKILFTCNLGNLMEL